MKKHALRTALTLYQGDTLDLETAASNAGVTPERLRDALDRTGRAAPEPAFERERVPIRAD